MSSQKKDARWQIAMNAAEAMGIEWNELDYIDTVHLLAVASSVLDKHPERVGIEAARWMERGVA